MSIVIVSNLTEFFKSELDKMPSIQSEETKFYLVDLLSRFAKSANFFEVRNGLNKIPTTIELIFEAEKEEKNETKRLLFRQAGDVCLYSIGFIKNSGVSNSYYEFIGKLAYSEVVNYSPRNQKDLYRNLSSNFCDIANALNGISRSLKIDRY